MIGRHFEDDPNMSFAMLEEDAVTKRPCKAFRLHIMLTLRLLSVITSASFVLCHAC